MKADQQSKTRRLVKMKTKNESFREQKRKKKIENDDREHKSQLHWLQVQ